MKPVSTTAVLAAITGSVANDPAPPLLVLQRSSSSLGSGSSEDGEEELLVGSVDQITPVSTNRSTKESWNTEEILNLLKMGNEQTKKTLGQIDNSLSDLVPDM